MPCQDPQSGAQPHGLQGGMFIEVGVVLTLPLMAGSGMNRSLAYAGKPGGPKPISCSDG